MNNIYIHKYLKYKRKYLKLKSQKTNINYQYAGSKPNFDEIKIYNEHGNLIDIKKIEHREQYLAKKYILPTDSVLELGARYGSVSVVVNKIITNKSNHIVVEPDSRVWSALEFNKKKNKCKFKIFKGLIGKHKYSLTNKEPWDGYATTMEPDSESDIESITLENLLNRYPINPNVLIVDCEGCFEIFVDENINFIKDLRLIMYEVDYPNKCDYIKIENILIKNRYKIVDIWSNQYVWKKISVGKNIDLNKQEKYLLANRRRLNLIPKQSI